MAISTFLDGVEVAITVDGNDLKEYHDDESSPEPRATSKYIEAQTGKTFAIRIKVNEDFDFIGNCVDFEVSIDGEWMRSTVVWENTYQAQPYSKVLEGKIGANGGLQGFQFTGIETVSDGLMLHRETMDLKDLGTIVVKVTHYKAHWHSRTMTVPVSVPKARRGSKATSPAKSNPESNVNATHQEEKSSDITKLVSEKAVKGRAISHAVQLVEEKQTRVTPTKPSNSAQTLGKVPTKKGKTKKKEKAEPKTEEYWEYDDILGTPSPAAVFVFKYRSLASIKALMVIPRTPTPPPLEDRDAKDLSIEELRELHRRSQAARKEQEAKQKIKREEQEDEPRRRKIARPNAKSTQLTIDDEGGFRQEAPSGGVATQPEVIELD